MEHRKGLPTGFLISLVVLSSLLQVINGFAYELTIVVNPGEMECFYQQIDVTNVDLEVEYQVLDGQGMDINFYLKAPNSLFLKTDQRTRSQSHELAITQSGIYELCFDNRYSHMNSKTVFFEVFCETEDVSFVNSEAAARLLAEKSAVKSSDAELVDMTVDQFKTSLLNVNHNVERIKSVQSVLRAHMTQDRNIQEENYTRVNIFSGLYLYVMVSVSVVQVLMIRNLFNNNSGSGSKTMAAST